VFFSSFVDGLHAINNNNATGNIRIRLFISTTIFRMPN